MTNPLLSLPVDELRTLRESHTLQEIADKYGCTREYVRLVCARHGIVVSGHSIRNKRRAELRQQALARMAEVGITQTSRELGITIKTLARWRARATDSL